MKKYTLNELRESRETMMKFSIEKIDNNLSLSEKNLQEAIIYYKKNSKNKKNPCKMRKRFKKAIKTLRYCEII